MLSFLYEHLLIREHLLITIPYTYLAFIDELMLHLNRRCYYLRLSDVSCVVHPQQIRRMIREIAGKMRCSQAFLPPIGSFLAAGW